MSGRRGMVLALAVTALGAALVLATAGKPRWSFAGATLEDGGVPAASALALVVLAGLGLLLLIGGRARTVLGALLVLAGGAIVLVDVYSGRGHLFFVTAPVGQERLELHRSVWFWLTAIGGAVLAGGGILIAVWGHRWPGPRRDYRARAEPSAVRRDPWTALDRGEDPTV